MSSIEERLNSLKEAFVGKSAEAEAKAVEVNALNAKVEELTAAVASKEAAVVEVAAKVASLEASLKDAVAKAEALMKEKAAIEASFETAGKKAAKIAASVGVEPLEVAWCGCFRSQDRRRSCPGMGGSQAKGRQGRFRVLYQEPFGDPACLWPPLIFHPKLTLNYYV